jgi:hypothetical protein
MKILLLFLVSVFLLVVIAKAVQSESVDNDLAKLSVKNAYDHQLEQRRQKSASLSAAEVEEMDIKDIREHLSWRGEPCTDCTHKRHLQQTLIDHIHAGTELSAKKYSQTSAQLRNWRLREGLGDNPHGNDPESKLRRFESRRRRHEDKNHPKAGLRNVMGAHGYDVNNHPLTQSHTGQKEVAQFMSQMRERARNHDPNRRDPIHQKEEAEKANGADL